MTSTWVAVLTALLSAGILVYIKDLIRFIYKRMKRTPQEIEQQRIHDSVRQADESLLVVSRARDELEADNKRLREERIEIEKRHAAERAEWAADRAALRREIEQMESRLRSALDDLSALRARHGFDPRGGE